MVGQNLPVFVFHNMLVLGIQSISDSMDMHHASASREDHIQLCPDRNGLPVCRTVSVYRVFHLLCCDRNKASCGDDKSKEGEALSSGTVLGFQHMLDPLYFPGRRNVFHIQYHDEQPEFKDILFTPDMGI